jgi:hypothetical protein
MAKRSGGATKPKGQAGAGAGESRGKDPAKSRLDVVPGTHLDEYAIPHLGLAVAFALALYARHQLVGDLARAMVATSLVISGVTVAWFVYQYAEARKPFQRAHATATAPLVGVAAAVTLLIGARPVWCWMFLLAGGTLGLTWNVRIARVVRGDGGDHHADDKGWDEVHGIPGARAKVVEKTENHRRVRVRLRGGQNRDDLAKAASSIESAAGSRYGSVRVVPSPGDRADEGDLILMERDVLQQPNRRPAWDGVRRKIQDGLLVGVFESGDAVSLRFAGGPKGPPVNVNIMGLSRSGKSHLFRLVVLWASECDDVVIWASDTIKGRQTMKPLQRAIDWLAVDKGETSEMITALDKVIRYRADWLGDRGLDEWQTGCGIPQLIAWFEEAARTTGSERFTRLTEAALSAGVIIVSSMQRASHGNQPTDARANMGANICFPVLDDTDSGFVLPNDIAKVSIAHLWGADLEHHQGYFYVAAPGVSHEQRLMPARTYSLDETGARLDPVTFTRLINERAPGMAELDEGTATAAGPAYADREHGRHAVDDPSAGAGADGRNGADRMDRDRTDGEDKRMDDYADEVDERSTDPNTYSDEDDDIETPQPHPDDRGDMARVDPRATLPPARGQFQLGLVGTPGDPLTGPQRHQAWMQVVDRVAGEMKPEPDGSVVVSLTDLLTAWFEVRGVDATTRPWVHARLAEWCEPLGELAERAGRGRYRLTPALLRRLGSGSLPVTPGDEEPAASPDVTPSDNGRPPL